MPFAVRVVDEEVELALSGRLSVQHVRRLWDELSPVLLPGRPVRVDAGSLEDMDSSIAQVLCRLAVGGQLFEVITASEGFHSSLASRGLSHLISQKQAPADPNPLDVHPFARLELELQLEPQPATDEWSVLTFPDPADGLAIAAPDASRSSPTGRTNA